MIGSVDSNGQLTTLQSYKVPWDGSCDRDGSCNECPLLRNRLSRYMLQPATNPNAATIVAFMAVHDQGDETYKCSALNRAEFYGTLAFFYTLQKLAPNPFNLRGIAIDTCSNYLRVDQDAFSLLASGQLCNTEYSFDGTISNSTIAGFVTSFSSNVEAINRVTKSVAIPIVSGGATAVVLSNKEKYPYFARTVPPDDKQMAVIGNILKQNDWTYVSVIYSRETYGIGGMRALREAGVTNNICLGSAHSLSYPGTLDEAKNIVGRLADTPEARVVIVIALNPRLILQAAKELGVLKRYIWIGSDYWGTKEDIVDGMKEDLLGSITIEIRSSIVGSFVDYVTELTYYNRKNIPNDWFEEFYQRIHKCRLSNAAEVLTQYPPCNLNEQISRDMVKEHAFILHTIAATYAMAESLQKLADRECPTLTFQECFSQQKNRELLFTELLQVTWSMQESNLGLNPNQAFNVGFNGDRYWDVGYTVQNYIKSQNEYIYNQIGSSAGGSVSYTESYQSYKQGDWVSECTGSRCKCDGFTPVTEALVQNFTKIKTPEARNFYYYIQSRNAFNNQVYDLVYTWPIWAIAVCVCTCAGLLLAILLFIYLIVKYPVRGGTTILGFLTLVGIIGIYCINFAFFLPASAATCGARRLLLGLFYTIVFSSLFVKAVDNWRFSDFEYTVHKYKGLTSSCTLLMVTIGIILVELIIPLEWLIMVPPTASNTNPLSMLHDWMWCDPVENYDRDLVLSMLFVIFLVIITGIFSGLAWNSDSNYYESRWIFVSSVSTAGCMLVWMIVVTNAGPSYRDVAVAMANVVNATALLIFIPIRKVVLLFRFKLEENMEKAQSLAEIDKATEAGAYSTVYSNPGYEDGGGYVVSNTSGSKHNGSDIGF